MSACCEAPRAIRVKHWSPLRRESRASPLAVTPPRMRWVELPPLHDEESNSCRSTMRESICSMESPAAPGLEGALLLRKFASRWPHRIGALELRMGSDTTYDEYVRMEPSSEDGEQIAADIDRSTVDGLEELTFTTFDAEEHAASLSRVLRAFCVRSPAGYCQGMNFCAAVLLVVMHHGASVDPSRQSADALAVSCVRDSAELVAKECKARGFHMPLW